MPLGKDSYDSHTEPLNLCVWIFVWLYKKERLCKALWLTDVFVAKIKHTSLLKSCFLMSILDNTTFRFLLSLFNPNPPNIPPTPFHDPILQRAQRQLSLKILKCAVRVWGTAGSLTIVLPWQHRIHQSGAPVKFLFPPLQPQIIMEQVSLQHRDITWL